MKRTLALLLMAGLALPASAAPMSEPFHVADRSPLNVNAGLPEPASARLTENGEYSIGLITDLSNISTFSANNRQTFTLDGESLRTNVRMRYGIFERWELGLDLVWLTHGSGTLDGFIDTWHDTFRLPGGDREHQPQDRLLYQYERDGELLIDFQRATSGPGDIRLTAAYQLHGDENVQRAIRATLELATGDADRMLGSGSTDISLTVVDTRRIRAEHPSLGLSSGLGALYTGKRDLLPDFQREWGVHAFTALDWQVTDRIALKAQLIGHSSLFTGNVEELQLHTIQLAFGGTAAIGRNWLLDLSLTEDLLGEAPDITFQVALRYLTLSP